MPVQGRHQRLALAIVRCSRRAIRKGMSECLSYTESIVDHSSSPSSFDAIFAHRCSEIVESESRLSVLISERRRDGSALALVQALPDYWFEMSHLLFSAGSLCGRGTRAIDGVGGSARSRHCSRPRIR